REARAVGEVERIGLAKIRAAAAARLGGASGKRRQLTNEHDEHHAGANRDDVANRQPHGPLLSPPQKSNRSMLPLLNSSGGPRTISDPWMSMAPSRPACNDRA